MEDNQGRYTLLTNERGTVIDDLIIFQRAKEKFYVVTNAGTRESHVHDVFITEEPPNYRPS